jgi:hypothetical protein
LQPFLGPEPWLSEEAGKKRSNKVGIPPKMLVISLDEHF